MTVMPGCSEIRFFKYSGERNWQDDGNAGQRYPGKKRKHRVRLEPDIQIETG
jgi:hypothetical protein